MASTWSISRCASRRFRRSGSRCFTAKSQYRKRNPATMQLKARKVGRTRVLPRRTSIQINGPDQKQPRRDELPRARRRGAGIFFLLMVRVNNHQQWRMREALTIVDFAAKLRQSLDLRCTELPCPVEVVEHDAGSFARAVKWLAIGRPRSGSRTVLQKDGALRGANQVGPIPRVAPWVKQPDLGTAVHTPWYGKTQGESLIRC